MRPTSAALLLALLLASCASGGLEPSRSPPVAPATPPAATPFEYDRDCDGIADRDDKCPEEPEDRDGFEDDDGCPDRDDDRDGIVDECDECPREPETFNGFRDDDGCPDKARILIQKSHIQIIERVYFDAGRATPSTQAKPLLDAIAAVLKERPEIMLVGVQGHASSDERDALGLSARRAHEVVRLLVKLGVDETRLEARGSAAALPIATNTTREGRERNRRVEFRLLASDDGQLASWDGQRFADLPRPEPNVAPPEPKRVCVPVRVPPLPAEPCRVAPRG